MTQGQRCFSQRVEAGEVEDALIDEICQLRVTLPAIHGGWYEIGHHIDVGCDGRSGPRPQIFELPQKVEGERAGPRPQFHNRQWLRRCLIVGSQILLEGKQRRRRGRCWDSTMWYGTVLSFQASSARSL
ncbi:MAG: hypothetical protein R2856_07810 [Caldilineaceae bacterium]